MVMTGELRIWEDRLVRVVAEAERGNEVTCEIVIPKNGLHPAKGDTVKVRGDELEMIRAYCDRTGQTLIVFGDGDGEDQRKKD